MNRFVLLAVFILFNSAFLHARTFVVEHAINVTKKGVVVKNGQKLDEKDVIVIGKNGTLLFVESGNKKGRWLVEKKNEVFKGKVGKLAKRKKRNLMTETLVYFNSLIFKNKSDDERNGGGVLRSGNDILEFWDSAPSITVDYETGIANDSIQFYYVK